MISVVYDTYGRPFVSSVQLCPCPSSHAGSPAWLRSLHDPDGFLHRRTSYPLSLSICTLHSLNVRLCSVNNNNVWIIVPLFMVDFCFSNSWWCECSAADTSLLSAVLPLWQGLLRQPAALLWDTRGRCWVTWHPTCSGKTLEVAHWQRI